MGIPKSGHGDPPSKPLETIVQGIIYISKFKLRMRHLVSAVSYFWSTLNNPSVIFNHGRTSIINTSPLNSKAHLTFLSCASSEPQILIRVHCEKALSLSNMSRSCLLFILIVSVTISTMILHVKATRPLSGSSTSPESSGTVYLDYERMMYQKIAILVSRLDSGQSPKGPGH